MVKKNIVQDRELRDRVRLLESLVLFTSLSFLFFKFTIYLIQNPFQGALELIWGVTILLIAIFFGFFTGLSLGVFGEIIFYSLNYYLPHLLNKKTAKFTGIIILILFALCVFIKYSSDTIYFWGAYGSFLFLILRGIIKLIRW